MEGRLIEIFVLVIAREDFMVNQIKRNLYWRILGLASRDKILNLMLQLGVTQ